MQQPKNKRNFILSIIAVLAALFGLWAFHNISPSKSAPTMASATLFAQPRIISPFELTDSTKQPFTLQNFKGHWSLVFFGFTNCPDLCPTTLATLNKTYKKLELAKVAPLPQIVFISVDPERDTLADIATYLSSFNPKFIGATGEKAQIDKLTQELSVLYAKISQPSADHPQNYTIDHSGTILIIDPQGHFRGVFTLPHDPDKIAQDLQTIVHHE